MNWGSFPAPYFVKIQNPKSKIQKNVLLKNYTTFKIGGPAKYFFIAKTKRDLVEAILWAKEKKLPFFVLGGGSNLLVSDKGYRGLIIKYQNANLSEFVDKGLEWAVGIPGTLAGAIRGNAGAFGKSMQDVVRTVEIFDSETGEIKVFTNRDCRFSYRDSIFKQNPNLIILSANVKTKKASPKKIKEYLEYRNERHPKKPSAGSVFKNVGSLPAALLIHQCGLTGKRIGGAEISKRHSNFIVNLGGAKAKDVLKLLHLVKQRVEKKFGIKLEEEIQIIHN